MADQRSTLKRIWDNLNPSEPSPLYLAKLMAFMIASFVIALIIGAYV